MHKKSFVSSPDRDGGTSAVTVREFRQIEIKQLPEINLGAVGDTLKFTQVLRKILLAGFVSLM